MGAFAISTRCSHGRIGHQVVHNYLMCRAHCRLLRRVFPPTSGGPFTCKIGFSGPMYRDTTDRPNYDIGSYALDRRAKYSDMVGQWGNEGCTGATDVMAFIDYAEQPVTWTLTDDGLGTIIDTGWHTWTNRIAWTRHGDWTPYDWDPRLGAYPQPSLWWNTPAWEANHGYPWQSPRIHPDWWKNVPPPLLCKDANGQTIQCQHPDNRNPWGLVCTSCSAAGIAERVSGIQNGCVFVTLEGGGYAEPVILAAAKFAAPLIWRLGGVVSVRYQGRFG